MPRAIRVVILGAAGRDFHNFNVAFRDDPNYEVVAFTAAQIPGISGRSYPASLAGALYPEGIPIVSEAELDTLVREGGTGNVVFAYSDVTHRTKRSRSTSRTSPRCPSRWRRSPTT
jgi:predicted GTPase